jgi:hypothetical protein
MSATFLDSQGLSVNMTRDSSVSLHAVMALAAILAGTALAGCGGSHGTARLGKEDGFTANPPRFLVGPTSILVTNADGFSARMTLAVSTSSNATHTTSGVLLGHASRLLYSPEKSDRTYIWDVDRNSGYLLSEAMQGYGPFKPTERTTTNFFVNAGTPVDERVNGHACQKTDWIAESSDGSRTRCSVWRADDLHGLPVRIKAVDRLSEFTIDLNDIRLGPPPEKLFTPPADFTAYSSADSMMTEMMMRATSAKQKPEYTQPETPPRVGGSPIPPNGRY